MKTSMKSNFMLFFYSLNIADVDKANLFINENVDVGLFVLFLLKAINRVSSLYKRCVTIHLVEKVLE